MADEAQPAGATRRRDDELLDAIFDAVIAELTEHGYHGVTFEGVTRRARTSKPVLYRRFKSRAELVAAAVIAREPLPTQPVHTGNLREELLSLFTLHEQRYQRLGAGVVRGLLAELPQERSAAFLRNGLDANTTPLHELLTAAVQRGELGPLDIPEEVVHVPVALLRHEFLTLGRVPKQQEVERMLDLLYLPLLALHSGATGALRQERSGAEAETPYVPNAPTP